MEAANKGQWVRKYGLMLICGRNAGVKRVTDLGLLCWLPLVRQTSNTDRKPCCASCLATASVPSLQVATRRNSFSGAAGPGRLCRAATDELERCAVQIAIGLWPDSSPTAATCSRSGIDAGSSIQTVSRRRSATLLLLKLSSGTTKGITGSCQRKPL